MTVSTTTSTVTYTGNGSTTTFTFPFIGVNASDIVVSYTNSSGSVIVLNPSLYTLVINAPAIGSLWGIGGSVTYPTSGPAIAVGTYLSITRAVPYTQNVSISNQGAFYPQAVEQGLDLLELQIQQIETAQEYSIQTPVTDPTPPSTLPSASVRAGNYLIFDSNGNPTVTPGTPGEIDIIGIGTNLVFLSGQTSLAVADALAASRNGTLVLDADATLTGNLSLTSPTILASGGVITLGAYNLTFTHNSIIAGGVQIFNCNSTGVVNGTISGKVCIDWWGTTSASIADPATTNAGNAALTYSIQANSTGETLYLTKGVYYLSGSWIKPSASNCPSIEGGRAVLHYNLSAAAAIVLIGGSGYNSQGQINGFHFIGSSTSWAIEVRGQCMVDIQECHFDINAVGIVCHNKDSGMFTEYVQWETCSFDSACSAAWWYKITSGNDSFNGSGPRGGVEIQGQTVGTTSPIVIDAAAVVYNAPCNFQVWVTDPTFPIISMGGSNARFFVYGTITIENFSGSSVTIATASSHTNMVLIGGFISWSGEPSLGDLVLMDEMSVRGNGTIPGFPKQFKITKALTTGSNSVTTSVFTSQNQLIDIEIVAPNYTYKYLLKTWADLFGSGGVTTLATEQTFNVAGYGAPTFGYSGGGPLTITNGSYPASGVTATLNITPMTSD